MKHAICARRTPALQHRALPFVAVYYLPPSTTTARTLYSMGIPRCSKYGFDVAKYIFEDQEAMLKEIVFSVRLVNATRYSTTESDEPAGPPQEPSSTYFVDLFDAVLDPNFDEDVFIGIEELGPIMPAGDHCSMRNRYKHSSCSDQTVRLPHLMGPYSSVTKNDHRTYAW